MLETDEVDDDFFAPVAGTSLANIFENVNKINQEKANDSLKYIPPKPQGIIQKQDQIKTTECIFACALIGHEWFNNVYTARGKLGFAIIKIQKTGAHNMVLYDANKTTLSCTTISIHLEVTIKNNTYISYYDNLKKYWSIYGTTEEVKKVIKHLTTLGVNIKHSTSDQGMPESTNVDVGTEVKSEQKEKVDKGSDTDSSINRKTKASILNRMANMGHSVLPTRALPVERTSDSSDTMETETPLKSVRHKPTKSVTKRNNVENISDSQQITESVQRTIVPKSESIASIPLYTAHASQLIPMSSTNLITSPSNEMSMFISEQRISNSELRINMNRITDKVDTVLDKINNFDHKVNTNVQTEILMKLLTEYENKIKVYEELLKSRDDQNLEPHNIIISKSDNQIKILKNKIIELEKINQEKSKEVLDLQKEIQLLKSKYNEEIHDHVNNEGVLLEKISNLENNYRGKDVELADIQKKYETLIVDTSSHHDNIGDKVKNIMNDMFQTISLNFDNNENYTGETVKKIIAAVIKKITIQTLKEL